MTFTPKSPGDPVIVLTTYEVNDSIFTALRAVTSAFLLSDARPGELGKAIRIVARGDALLARR